MGCLVRELGMRIVSVSTMPSCPLLQSLLY